MHASVDAALSTAFEEHRALVSTVLTRRIVVPFSGPTASAVTEVAPHPQFKPLGKAFGRRTARELVLEAIAQASSPISFADVKAAVAAACGSQQGAHKVRTDLLKRGAIMSRRGLCTITDAGREMRTAYD